MIDVAIKYEDEIKKLYPSTWFDDKYAYYWATNYRFSYEIKPGTWNGCQFVSLDNTGKVLGLIGYTISRESDYVDGLAIINFSDNKVVFGRDVQKVIDDMFTKYNFRKLEFYVIVGNPIEHTYDRLIKKYHGKIVGVYTDHVKLMDNYYYDEKIYEIFRDDYIMWKDIYRRRRCINKKEELKND